MSTFTCSHHNVPEDWCLLLKTDCVPGRPGCVLRGKSEFLFPAEERIRDEVARGTVAVKDLSRGEQFEAPDAELATALLKAKGDQHA